jgi:tRNA (guanine-N7-)-methyltransferase
LSESDLRAPVLYGRRRGRALRSGRRELVQSLLPQVCISLPANGPLDPRRLFPAARAIFLELGFGGGEHLAALAEAHPDAGLIGAEVFENGVAKLLARMAQRNFGSIRIYPGDGRVLAAALTDRCIDRAFILFPDPWPKERHKKRRIVAPPLLDAIARVLIDCGTLRLATDDEDYAVNMRERLGAHAAFRKTVEVHARPADWPETRYEQKARAAGRTPLYLEYARRPRGE